LNLVLIADLESLPFSDHLQIYRAGLSIGQRLVSSKKMPDICALRREGYRPDAVVKSGRDLAIGNKMRFPSAPGGIARSIKWLLISKKPPAVNRDSPILCRAIPAQNP
jgi:hypothetical protein